MNNSTILELTKMLQVGIKEIDVEISKHFNADGIATDQALVNELYKCRIALQYSVSYLHGLIDQVDN